MAKQQQEKGGKIIPTCTWWTVWREKDKRYSEDWQNGLKKFKMNNLALHYFWCKQEILVQTEDITKVKFASRNTFERGLHILR